MEKNKLFSSFVRWVNGEAQPKEKKNAFSESAAEEKPHKAASEEKRVATFIKAYHVIAVVVCLSMVAALLITVFHLPLFGSPNNPACNEVVERYVEKGIEETGAVNVVAGMILDYRAFDTLGESSVLFLAVTSVMILLLRDKNNISAEEDIATLHELVIEKDTRDVIVQRVIGILFPCIMLFGVYVVLNGHLSPGGGFSGGAIMGGGLIVYSASFGTKCAGQIFNMKTFRVITSTALLCYAASKAYSFFTGANGLHSMIPLGTPGAILSSGLILVLDICVGAIVACTMYGFYALFARGEI